MKILAILAFFFITWAYGFTVLKLSKVREEHPLYNFFAQLAVGMAVFSLMGVVLNVLHIPIHYSAYLILAIIYPAYTIYQMTRRKLKFPKLKINIHSKEFWVIVGLIFIIFTFFAIYMKGAFVYPYLEDDDPWGHAIGTKYVALEHTYDQYQHFKQTGQIFAGYLEPYPPTYDVIMAVMNQIESSMNWVLKFFNVLMITLGLVFAFLFAKEYFQSSAKALFTVFILATLPSFMSHFIWSQTLALTLFMVAGYAMLKAKDDKQWIIPAAIVIGSMMVTQPVVSMVFGFMMVMLFVVCAVRDAITRKLSSETKNLFITGVAGILVSLIFWGQQIAKFGVKGIMAIKGGEFTGGWGGDYALQKYTLAQFVFAPPSRIDQATGVGLAVALLIALTIIIYILYAKKIFSDYKRVFLFIWFGFLLFAIWSATLGTPILGVSRAWSYLAIPLAFFVTDGLFIVTKSLNKSLRAGAFLVVIALVILTGAVPKYQMQTSIWPPGVHWTSEQELQGYTALMQLPPNQKILELCSNGKKVLGFNHIDYLWNTEIRAFKQEITLKTGEDIIKLMDKYQYKYITLDTSCVATLGQNNTEALVARISNTQRFRPVLQPQGFLLAERII